MAYYNDKGQLKKACKAGNLAAVKQLIEMNANPNSIYNGRNSLHDACESGHLDIVKLLIANKADVNIDDNDYYTPLDIAIKNNHLEIAKLLIDNNANINISRVHSKEYNCYVTPLYTAIKINDLEWMEHLFELGADVNEVSGSSGYWLPPLHVAIQYGTADAVKLLIEKGAKINQGVFCSDFESGMTPIYMAVKHKKIDAVKLLLASGVDINQTTPKAYTTHSSITGMDLIGILKTETTYELTGGKLSLLHLAVLNRDLDMVKLLIRKKARLDKKNWQENTPLHLAILNNDLQMVNLLLKAGASLDQKGMHDNTPLDLAIQFGNIQLTKLLREEQLKRAVQSMKKYGELLKEQDKEKSQEAIKLATELMDRVEQFIEQSNTKKLSNTEINDFITNIQELARSKDAVMNKHRKIWKPIVANILIALTGIVLVALAISLLHAVYNNKTITFNEHFFFAKTRLQQKNEDIKEAVNLFKPFGTVE